MAEHVSKASQRLIEVSKSCNGKAPLPLPGEDISSSRWDDCRHWIAIYAGLLQFKTELLEYIRLQLLKLPAEARQDASVDLVILGDQRARYEQRLDLWYQRVWDLEGLSIDPDGHAVRYGANKAPVTDRERQFLEFLVRHPHREYSADEILTHAWPESGLHEADVTMYVERVRSVLRSLALPCRLVARPGRGYALILSPD